MFKRRVGIIGDVVIISPFGASRSPIEFLNCRLKTLDQTCHRLSAHRTAARLDFLARVFFLRARVDMNVREQSKIEACLRREQFTCKIERHSVNVGAQKLTQAHVAQRHQRQRREKMLAELFICHPRLSLLIHFKRQRIDQRRFAAHELHVVRARVFQRHVRFQRALLDGQRRQRGRLQLPERPFIRIRNERHALRLDDFKSRFALRGNLIRFDMRNQKPSLHQPLVQPRLDQTRIIALVSAINLSVQDSASRKQKPAGVPKRSG